MEMIYQFSPKPIDGEHYCTADDYEDSWFVPAVAEYVRDPIDQQSEVCILLNILEGRQIATVDRETNSFTLLSNVKDTYFAGRYGKFQEVLADLMVVSEETFISNHNKVENILMNLNACFSDKFGTYVATDEESLISLDEFIRNADVENPYYVGGIVYYHI